MNEADREAKAADDRTRRAAASAALRLDADAASGQRAQWAEIDTLADAALTRLEDQGWPGSTLLTTRSSRFGLATTKQRAAWQVGRRIGWDGEATTENPCWLLSTGRFGYGPANERVDEQPFPELVAMHGFEDVVIEGLEKLADQPGPGLDV